MTINQPEAYMGDGPMAEAMAAARQDEAKDEYVLRQRWLGDQVRSRGVDRSMAAGVGNRVVTDVVGKSTDRHGDQIADVDGRDVPFRAVPSRMTSVGPFRGTDDDVTVVCAERRASAFDPEIWRHVGCPPERFEYDRILPADLSAGRSARRRVSGESVTKEPVPQVQGAPATAAHMDDDAEPAWRTLPSMPTTRHDHGCLVHDGELLVISGFDDTETYAETEVLDTSRYEWHRGRSPIPTGRGLFGGTRCAEHYYVIGGKSLRPAFVADGTGPQYEVYGAVERYDLQNDAWEATSALDGPRAGLGACTLEGEIYAIAGMACPNPDRFPDPAFVTDRVDVYDPETDVWRTGPALPEPRYCPSVEAVSGRIVVAGGSAGGRMRSDVFILEAPTEEWTTASPIPTPRRNAATFVANGHLYLVGGLSDDDRYLQSGYRYDPAADEWTSLPTHPTAKAWAGATVYNGVAYVVGGARWSSRQERYAFLDEVHEIELP